MEALPDDPPAHDIAASCVELRADLDALEHRARELRDRLRGHARRLDGRAREIPMACVSAVVPHARSLADQCDALASRARTAATRPGDDAAGLARLRRACQDAAWRWRSVLGLAAALLAAPDWQAPSFAHARRSHAGTQAGLVTGTKNDYQRDHHAAADRFEAAWLRAFVDAPPGLPLQAYATASGMAAFAVAAAFVHRIAGEAPVLLGRACWFQNRVVVRDLWSARRTLDVDEHDVEGIAALVDKSAAGALFLDSMGNTEGLPMVDLRRLAALLAQRARRPFVLVVDNTLLCTASQPALALPGASSHLRLIVTESLNKYHQHGADRVGAGMVWAAGAGLEGLFEVRMVLGCNIADTHVHALPAPDRARLDARLARIGRNAGRLAERLQEAIEAAHGALPFAAVVHPTLAHHPASARVRGLPFCGGTLSLVPTAAYRGSDAALRFIGLAIAAARQAGVELVAGAGFGFDHTRLYLTALFSAGHTRPFLRVAAGAECRVDAERLAAALVRAMHALAACPPSSLADDHSVALRLQRESLRRQPLGKWRGMPAWPQGPTAGR